jgi:antitoxin (DNA-binding transcriptional repressor) of toxin-antitoxin stability system
MMLDMRKATIRQVQHNLREVLAWVEQGEEVSVLRRNKVVAKLVPPRPQPGASPDFLARATAVWGANPRGLPLSSVASEARGAR